MYHTHGQFGIIPTRMGTRASTAVTNALEQDHPHAYGDKGDSLFLLQNFKGSSPRVWGQDYVPTAHIQFERIITTRMGTSKKKEVKNPVDEDHPHAYGDKLSRLIRHCLMIGSSPRVWGQGKSYKFKLGFSGIIPTRMGTRNTLYQEQAPY